MGRPPKFTVDDMLDAAAELLVDGGLPALTATGVALHLSAASGSVYHRFGTRDELAAALWMRTVERFDVDVVEALRTTGDPVDVAVAAARRMIAWSREQPIDAFILTMFRREDLAGGEVGAELAARATALGRRQKATIRQLAGRLGSTPGEVSFAVAGIPMAAVRGPIERKEPIPAWVPDAVERAVRAALTVPDRRRRARPQEAS